MPRTPKPKAAPIEVEALRHNDTRVNIPTSELRDFAGNDETQPFDLRYPRDPSLDPQLVWQGKDAQDGDDLIVPAVPIYIQEKIHPGAIVEEVRRNAAPAADLPQQMNLFSDFNGIDDFDKLIEFYQHQQHWTNRMILGDSLMVMASLAEKEGLKGKVQMIYLDPPYGIKFGSNWQVSTRKRDVKDGRQEDLVRQPEQVRAFRDTWERGIHSYLSYLRDRLTVARELLTESGSIFVQIGDENVHLVRSLLDEVFGSENFVSLITVQKTGQKSSATIDAVSDYIIWYAKNKLISGKVLAMKYRQLYKKETFNALLHDGYRYVQSSDGLKRSMTEDERNGRISLHPDYRPFQSVSLHSQGKSENTNTPIILFGESFFCPPNRHWGNDPKTIEKAAKFGYVILHGSTPRQAIFFDENPGVPLTNLWSDTMGAADQIYVVQSNTKLIERCLLMTTDPGDLVLDPTMGSGTTAYVAEQWGRRWITVDTSRVALALARTRLMAARFPYYLLADSPEGARKDMELLGTVFPPRPYTGGVKQGFVYERVPHITLRDIANNEEIDTIHAAHQPVLEERRLWLNDTLGVTWEEWQVPRELPAAARTMQASSLQEIERVLAEYWQGRRARQAQIDASIQRSSTSETLVDKPYEDRSKIRVTGPFTVETLSPHRVLDPGSAQSAVDAARTPANVGTYEQMVIDNLRIAGVQNTLRDQRLKFDTLDSFAHAWLHAVGTYTDLNGIERRVAVSIGSEHGTVTARQIKQAAIEAVKGIPYDLLLICGFAFDPAVHEEAKRYGAMEVQVVRMNSDLMMGGILKQTDRANLFTIFGEPDLTIERTADGQLIVELRGLDIYDPTRGQIRSSSVDDIACWFIDTAYDETSFFVRHAYFLGNDSAYDSLKRALRAEVDESAWSVLYSARSMPFDKPESGRIAVKVINHYGDEVLKVFSV